MKEPRSSDFMKSKSRFSINNDTLIGTVLFFLAIFFILQLAGQIFSSLGEKSKGKRGMNYLGISSTIFPLEAKSSCRLGFQLIEESSQSGSTDSLQQSIAYLQKALKINPLYYQSYLLLGKAYLYKNRTDFSSFQDGLLNLKSASRLRGNKIWVSVDTLKVLLAIWPHLEEEEKSFGKKLLERSIKRMGGDDFNAILDIWGLYSRDISFFKDSIEKRPRYMGNVTQKLMELEIESDARNRLLSIYAGFKLEKIKNSFLKIQGERSSDGMAQIESLYDQLKKISIYFFIDSQDKLTRKSYLDLKKDLTLALLDILFLNEQWADDKIQRAHVEQYISDYLEDFGGSKELGELSNYLAEQKNFDSTNLRSFYINQLLKFNSAQYDSVISDCENLRRSLKFVSKGSMKDYSDILLLLVDSYIASRLLTRASSIIKELDIEVTNPEQIYWRKYQVEQVIGPEREEDGQKDRYYSIIKESRSIELNSPPIKKIVYLDSNKEIEITFSDWLKKRTKDFHLLQICEKGRIIYESYLGELTPPIKVRLHSDKKFSRHTLTIKLN